MQFHADFPASLPKLIKDYLADAEDLASCYQFRPSLHGLVEAAEQRAAFPVDRSTLVSALSAQAKASNYASEASQENIAALGNEDVFTITTGHQLCVYGGPMFFIYKIISAVKWCRQLQAKGIKAVPVYWMASEDHDFAEINHIYVRDQRFSWDREAGGGVGRMKLQDIEPLQQALRELLLDDYHAQEALDELQKIFAPNRLLNEAIRDFVYHVFAREGVVVIDADDPALKAGFRPVIEKELNEHFSEKAVINKTEALESLGFSGQVTPREINLFWLEGDVRERLVRTENGFALADDSRTFTAQEIEGAIQNRPECFSPNVILRPVYQEVILPNLAYIGGPGELSYWLQLKDVFDDSSVFFPVLLLRDMVAVMIPKVQKRLEQLSLSPEDMYRDRELLIKELLRKEGTHEALVEEKASAVDALMESMKKELHAFDATLAESAAAESKRVANRFEALRKKVLRAEKRKHETLLERLDEAQQWFFPGGVPQERVQNFLALCPDPEALIDEVLKTPSEPFDRVKVMLATERFSVDDERLRQSPN